MAVPRRWRKHFPADFWNDDKVQVMNWEEVGAFLFLLDYQWQYGGIPNDWQIIRRLLKSSSSNNSRMKKIWEMVGPCFVPSSDGTLLVNKRLERIEEANSDRKNKRQTPDLAEKADKKRHNTSPKRGGIMQRITREHFSDSRLVKTCLEELARRGKTATEYHLDECVRQACCVRRKLREGKAKNPGGMFRDRITRVLSGCPYGVRIADEELARKLLTEYRRAK